MKTIILFSLSLFILSCGTQKKATEITDVKQSSNSNTMITATIGDTHVPTDPITISDIKVHGNNLLIDVSYSGGCAEHSFSVVGSAIIAKSLPPIRSIQLVHKANGDQCKKMEMKTLVVDIKALADQQEVGSKIYLTLEGWKERIEYTFE